MIPELDPSSPVPIYLQIVEQIRRLIALGALRPGDRLPTVRDLAVRCRVNRNTAARAILELEREGVLRTRVGQGTFVSEEAPRLDRMERNGILEASLDRLVIEAHSLGVPLEELGSKLTRRIDRFKRQRKAAARQAAVNPLRVGKGAR